MTSTEKMMADESYLKRISKLLTEDAELVAMFPDLELHKSTLEAKLLAPQAVDRLLAGYADRPALGHARLRDQEQSQKRENGTPLPAFIFYYKLPAIQAACTGGSLSLEKQSRGGRWA